MELTAEFKNSDTNDIKEGKRIGKVAHEYELCLVERMSKKKKENEQKHIFSIHRDGQGEALQRGSTFGKKKLCLSKQMATGKED